MKRALVATALAIAATAGAADTGIGTWNLAWLMGQATHARWVSACSAIGWQTLDDLKASGKSIPASLAGLPYCDVHNGINWRSATCAAALKDALARRPTNADTADGKCRVSPDLADWTQYARKLATLRETFLDLARNGAGLVALQEVFDEDAAATILPAGWKAVTSASLQGAVPIPQQVGLAWNPSAVTPRDFKLVTALSAIGERPLRPGLQFTADIQGKSVDFLVVHLKAGCRGTAINAPTKDSEKQACPLMAQQVRVVEDWIDARVGRDFVVLGDFNRTLLAEVDTAGAPDPVRFGRTPVSSIAMAAPEWNDGDPAGSLVYVVPHKKKPDGSLIAGDYFCGETKGIDHVVISDQLRRRLKPTDPAVGLEMLPQSYRFNGARLPIGTTTVPPSDHCARFMRIGS